MIQENQNEQKACTCCKGRGELTTCCDAIQKLHGRVAHCSNCNAVKPKTYNCDYCEGEGVEPEYAERDRAEDARESYLEALRDE